MLSLLSLLLRCNHHHDGESIVMFSFKMMMMVMMMMTMMIMTLMMVVAMMMIVRVLGCFVKIRRFAGL